MKPDRYRLLSRVRFCIGPGQEQGAILFLWGYDLVKFWVLQDLLAGQGIDPVMFLFFDMVTVPPFVMGTARLVNALAGTVLAWPLVLGWGGIVLVNTLMPYLYAAAGQSRFTREVWMIFGGLVLLVLANLVRTIRCQVSRQRGRDREKALPDQSAPDPTPPGRQGQGEWGA